MSEQVTLICVEDPEKWSLVQREDGSVLAFYLGGAPENEGNLPCFDTLTADEVREITKDVRKACKAFRDARERG